jgi:hypothetical protein
MQSNIIPSIDYLAFSTADTFTGKFNNITKYPFHLPFSINALMRKIIKSNKESIQVKRFYKSAAEFNFYILEVNYHVPEESLGFPLRDNIYLHRRIKIFCHSKSIKRRPI